MSLRCSMAKVRHRRTSGASRRGRKAKREGREERGRGKGRAVAEEKRESEEITQADVTPSRATPS